MATKQTTKSNYKVYIVDAIIAGKSRDEISKLTDLQFKDLAVSKGKKLTISAFNKAKFYYDTFTYIKILR